MAAPTTSVFLNKTTPAAPTGQQNVVFQTDGGTPSQDITAYDQVMVGDTGSGGLAGNVPAPPSGSAAAGKFLKADGTWASPTNRTKELSSAVAGLPGPSMNVLIYTSVSAVTLAGNLAGAFGSVGANPTATATYTVKKTSGGTTTSVGTIAISTSGGFTFATTSGATVSLAAGDRLTVVSPATVDVTLADVSFTLVGTY